MTSYWPTVMIDDELIYLLSSLIGSSNSSGDTEVSSDTGSAREVQLDMALQNSPPYHLQVVWHSHQPSLLIIIIILVITKIILIILTFKSFLMPIAYGVDSRL